MRFLITVLLLWGSLCGVTQADSRAELRNTVLEYYSIPVKAESIDWNNENVAKNQLLAIFQTVLTGSALQRTTKWIETTSTRSSHYVFLLDGMRTSTTPSFLAFDQKGSESYSVLVRRTMRETFSEAENLKGIEGFVAKYRITNYTQSDIERIHAQSKLPELIAYIVKSEVEEEFELKQVKNGWRIAEVRPVKVISSTLEIREPSRSGK